MSPAITSYPSYDFSFQSSLSKLSLNSSDCSVNLRDGLLTPPSDMSGVAFNPQLTKQHQYPHYSKISRVPLANTVSNANPTSYLPPMVKTPMSVDPKPQESHSEDPVAKLLRLLASINCSLTEFAAQVHTIHTIPTVTLEPC